MKALPVGIQSFEDLRNMGYLYVDKTEDIHRLITSGKIYFLSRPRRFGKSLLVSTLGELFKGEKSLFEGLYICDKYDWTQQYPIITIDWSIIKHATSEEMERDMCRFLSQIAAKYQITLLSDYASGKFAELIECLFEKKGRKVVVLVDEYDKPILDAMFARIPYQLHIPCDAYYHSLILLWLNMLGFDVLGEVPTDIGRIDAVWRQEDRVVIAEIKHDENSTLEALLQEAFEQIHDRRYYEAFSRKNRRVALLAIAIAGKETACRMEEL